MGRQEKKEKNNERECVSREGERDGGRESKGEGEGSRERKK